MTATYRVAADASRESKPPVRVLLVTGGHSHELSFYEMFSAQNGLTVTVRPHPRAFREGMAGQSDVLVLYDLADVTEEAERTNLKAFVESGKGIVVLHHAIADNQTWPWWYEEVVGGRYLLTATDDHDASRFKEDVEFTVRPTVQHPVLDGIGPFQINDEAYKDLWISPKVHVLLETDNILNDKPMAWVSPYPKSRVVYIQLGHGPNAHRNPVYRKLVHNAIMWSAGRL
jgi:type 1 glutamine amidotransferase